jgi:hypothetical protein
VGVFFFTARNLHISQSDKTASKQIWKRRKRRKRGEKKGRKISAKMRDFFLSGYECGFQSKAAAILQSKLALLRRPRIQGRAAVLPCQEETVHRALSGCAGAVLRMTLLMVSAK